MPQTKTRLPPELSQAILWAGVPWSTDDARALSQSCHAFDTWISEAQPQTYRQAHHQSLVKALGTGPFLFDNPRVQSVLGAFDTLHLTDDCDLSRSNARRLTRVVNTTHHVEGVHLETQQNIIPPWTRLFVSGLRAHDLTSLNLEAASMPWAEVQQFFAALPQCTNLEKVTLYTLGFMPEHMYPYGVSFLPLTNLRELTWRTLGSQGHTVVNLTTNEKLRHLKLDFGSFSGLALQGWELGNHPLRNTVLLPSAPLEILHLETLLVSPATAYRLTQAPWKDSLVELHLTFAREGPSPQVDLSAHTALKELFLTYRGREITDLRLPPPQRLKTLALMGDALAGLLQQLATPVNSALTTLFLHCNVDRTSAASSIPWASLPALENLMDWAYHCAGDTMRLWNLDIPKHNILQRLRLCGTITSPDEWHFEDLALKGLTMPRLRTLDLNGLLVLGDDTIEAVIGSFEEALSQRDRWPALEEIVVTGGEYAPTFGAVVQQMAMRLGLRCTLTGRYMWPRWAV